MLNKREWNLSRKSTVPFMSRRCFYKHITPWRFYRITWPTDYVSSQLIFQYSFKSKFTSIIICMKIYLVLKDKNIFSFYLFFSFFNKWQEMLISIKIRPLIINIDTYLDTTDKENLKQTKFFSLTNFSFFEMIDAKIKSKTKTERHQCVFAGKLSI